MSHAAVTKGIVPISPTIKSYCDFELKQQCNGFDKDADQKQQMGCLMRMTHSVGSRGTMSEGCSRAIESKIYFTSRFIRAMTGMKKCNADLSKLCSINLSKQKFKRDTDKSEKKQ